MTDCKKYDRLDEICVQCSINHVEEHNVCYVCGKEPIEKMQETIDLLQEMEAVFGKEKVFEFAGMVSYAYRCGARFKKGKNAEEAHKAADWWLSYIEENQ